jgi:hypothetical protein
MSKKSRDLTEVLPENLQAAAASSRQTTQIPYISTVEVAKNPVWDASQYEGAYMANAAAQSEHLNFAAQISTLREPLNVLKHDFANTALQLKDVKHLDTRVNIVRDKRVHKIDISGELKAYANRLDQPTYLQILLTFLNQERMIKLHNFIVKGGQIDTPALWLNQQLSIETKMPYVNTLNREIAPGLVKECEEKIAKIEEKQAGLCDQAFRHCFGPELYEALALVADVTKLHIYIVVVMLVDKIIELHEVTSQPSATTNLWQSVLENR